MQNGGVILVNTSLMQTGSNVSDPCLWNGGQGTLTIAAQQFAPIVNLIFKTPNGQPIKLNESNIQANDNLPFRLPAGSYELHSANGSSIGLFAALLPTP